MSILTRIQFNQPNSKIHISMRWRIENSAINCLRRPMCSTKFCMYDSTIIDIISKNKTFSLDVHIESACITTNFTRIIYVLLLTGYLLIRNILEIFLWGHDVVYFLPKCWFCKEKSDEVERQKGVNKRLERFFSSLDQVNYAWISPRRRVFMLFLFIIIGSRRGTNLWRYSVPKGMSLC